MKLNAAARLKAHPEWMTSNDWELLNIWFNLGQFDDSVHAELLPVFEKVGKHLPAARKLPAGLAYRGYVFKAKEFDTAMNKGQLKLKPAAFASWTMSQAIALDYAKMADATEVGIIVGRSLKPADVLMYASPAVLKALDVKGENQHEVLVRGTGLPSSGLLPDFVDFVYVPKLKKAIRGDQYFQSKGIEV